MYCLVSGTCIIRYYLESLYTNECFAIHFYFSNPNECRIRQVPINGILIIMSSNVDEVIKYLWTFWF